MELIQRFILTPVEGRTLQENAQEHGHREPHTHFQEHFEYEPFPSRDGDGSNENREELTETGELGELGESGRSDELGEYGTTHSTTHSTTHNHPIHPLEESHRIPAGSNTSLNSGQKTGPVAPDAPFTKKVDGKERPGPTEEDHEKKAEQMGKMDEFVTGMGQGAYDRSMERGLLPEEAEANRAAAQSYARAYEEYKMDGLSPEEADQRARSIFKDMNSIAPNGADLFSDLNTLTIINESRESVPSGTLGERYPSAMLESEAAHARDREVKEVEKRKDAANLVSHALERDGALKNRIQEEMAAVVEKLRALRRMKADTIESRVDSNNNSPGEIEDPAVKERLKTVRETYGQMVAESQAPPRRRSLKDLTMQNEKDEKMAEENRRVYTEHVEGRRAAAAAQEQRAAETAERIEKEEAVERAIPGGYDNEAVNRTLSESAEQKANEQAEAQEQIDEVVATAGETAYQNVMSLGGSVEEAEKSQTEAARLKTDQIKEEMDQRVDEIKEQLGEQMDPQTAESMARHIVTVHELKEVLKTIERGGSVDTSSNTISSNSNTTTNTSNTTNITNNVTIISATPDDEGTVSLEHVVLTLPLPADAEPTPRTEADQQNEEIVEERRETYRNTRVDTGGKPFYTGLPELVGEDGSTTILSEGLHKIIVGKGRIEMDENTVEQMRSLDLMERDRPQL
ncbi:hypothetical protein ECANGB1_1197 [Enterospora canceri]|uniref:Uncharacterized protein n=1 Tax=Enterospora canceri TaxID=1081671 RepID=A0A1Y1S6I7_9MICR|nr:hypothetical protein ECANGB1_1197 [Enterospora canceri]